MTTTVSIDAATLECSVLEAGTAAVGGRRQYRNTALSTARAVKTSQFTSYQLSRMDPRDALCDQLFHNFVTKYLANAHSSFTGTFYSANCAVLHYTRLHVLKLDLIEVDGVTCDIPCHD